MAQHAAPGCDARPQDAQEPGTPCEGLATIQREALLKLKAKRFQHQSVDTQTPFGITYRVTASEAERDLSLKYPLDPDLVFEATGVMSSQPPSMAEYTEYYKTQTEAEQAEQDKALACRNLTQYLYEVSQFSGEGR